jgi:predicted RNase H-like nuclease (RuvC/YqgF family)
MKIPFITIRKITIVIAVLFVLLILLLIINNSTKRHRKGKENDVVIHVSETNQEEKPRRSGYIESPIDLLNKEILNENPNLQKLEEEIKNSKIEQYSLSKQLTDYKDRFDRLYNSTQNIANEIIDSSAQKSMKVHIQLQIDKYTKKINELDYLIKSLEKKSNLLNDKHVELKIELILEKIETIHQNELPGKKEYVDLFINQEKLINRTINMFPKK